MRWLTKTPYSSVPALPPLSHFSTHCGSPVENFFSSGWHCAGIPQSPYCSAGLPGICWMFKTLGFLSSCNLLDLNFLCLPLSKGGELFHDLQALMQGLFRIHFAPSWKSDPENGFSSTQLIHFFLFHTRCKFISGQTPGVCWGPEDSGWSYKAGCVHRCKVLQYAPKVLYSR